ncbi:unnamed protein product [Cuscuta epithymum]|uniref:Phosphatidic acid phosphatase type 2/haloperoxidase domain-containing protein n=2 Tax=Cuscuta epithymum TaxID=186058 RepID=A0AAV0FAF4_9ASTE|nr:unnamed protein product [Cuscuta epithymum]
MSAAAAGLILPVPGFCCTRLRCTAQSPAFRVDFPPHKSVHWDSRNFTMNGAVAARINAHDEDQGGLAALEQEPLINDSIVVAASRLEATLNNTSKWLFAVLFGLTLVSKHDAQALWASIGSVLNSLLSYILKRILNQRRPVPTSRSDPGMPSSHAQSIFYIVTFTTILMIQSFGLSGLTAALGGLIFALGCYFSWLRISQKLHTTSQVFVGAMVGFGFSILWFWLWDAIMLMAFQSLVWFRTIVILSAAGLCSGFLVYVIRYWILDEQRKISEIKYPDRS